jgi:hypothetical protein
LTLNSGIGTLDLAEKQSMIEHFWGRNMKRFPIAALVVVLSSSTPAMAFDLTIRAAHVTEIDASLMPNDVLFRVDKGPITSSSCPAGSDLHWLTPSTTALSDVLTKQKNVEAVYSMLLAANLSGRTVDLQGFASRCRVGSIVLND